MKQMAQMVFDYSKHTALFVKSDKFGPIRDYF